MMFLIRAAFWLIILVLLLPTDQQQQSEVYGTAQAAVKDVSGFCSRNPGVCDTGKDAFDVFVHKAQFGAELIMGFIREQTGGAAGGSETPSAEGTPAADNASGEDANVAQAGIGPWTVTPVTAEPANVEAINSQNTLKPDDLAPAWSGPRQAGI